ncbi:hypothetical protein OUZ56_012995 [Daphnia magna]|uniref:Reverse transcriptase/retrotransposon-derived protein RNase H-like domain-containing protein n=1 Tax=Daphnia magna TaxID=35525 RepID=A0ABQ9Z4M8_9CRUS|nr:hypothetical protein OUZ56_012995 [Daphnia magna]
MLLSEHLRALCDKNRSLQAILNNSSPYEEAEPLLKKMLQQSVSQSKKKSNGYRYMDQALNNFCLNTYILGGRRLYEIFHVNFKGVFPSPRTMGERLAKHQTFIPEGVVNVEGLKEYLTLHNLPMMVSLSEDATAAVGKRQYNSTTNSIYGFSLPLQPNGLPNWKDSVINSALDAELKAMREMLQLGVVQRTNAEKVFPGNSCPWFVSKIDKDAPITVTSECSLNAIIFRDKTSRLLQPKKMCPRPLPDPTAPITGDASPSAPLAACAPSRSRP